MDAILPRGGARPAGLVPRLKRLLAAVLPARVRRRWEASPLEFYSESYSQEGEDMILRRIFEERRGGFYVDVGAHHPTRYSNTYLFYKWLGWRGINIDALPGSMALFRRLRPEDINLEVAISDEPGTFTYYEFDEPALNGLSPELSRERAAAGTAELIAQTPVRTRTLAEVLAEHLPAGREIDFLSVDVEGLDLEVLRSSDWSRYRPAVVLVEDMEATELAAAAETRLSRFLRDQGYALSCRTPHTSIFRKVRP
jgi:FkbM family methyltransferase